jgi:hypothetical protein
MPVGTRSLMRKRKKHMSKSPQVQPDQFGLPRAIGFNGYFGLSLVIGLSCHHRRPQCESIAARLISASRYQDHTTSPSAPVRFVTARRKRPSHPALNVRDDREAPLLEERGTG